MKRLLVLFMLFTVLIASPVFAEDTNNNSNNTGNTNTEKVLVDKKDLPKEVLDKVETKQEMNKYGEWVGFGKEMGIAVNEVARSLTMTAADFAKTDLGKFTMFAIGWKMFGKDMVQIVIGVGMLFIGSIIFLIVFWKNRVSRRILIENANGVKKYEMFEPDNSYNDIPPNLGYAAIYFIYLAICMAVTFG